MLLGLDRDLSNTRGEPVFTPTPEQTRPLGSGDAPSVSKPLDAPVIDWADQTAESMYWPWLVDLSQDGVGTGWAWLWSTDHAAVHADSGIWAATGATPFEVTTHLGRIYRDDVGGNQTETPSVIWDPAINFWRIFYQQASPPGAFAEQATLMALAPAGQLLNGASWLRIGVVIDAGVASPTPGALKHEGYFRPFRYAAGWYGFNLCGGSNYGGQQQQRSYDGAKWYPTGRVPTQGPAARLVTGLDPLAWVINWTWTNVLDWRGAPWMVGAAGGIASGTDDPPPRRIVTAPLDPELRRPVAPLLDVTPAAQAWETNAIDSMGNAAIYDGRVLMPYRSNLHQGAFSLLEVS